ncbi:MAG: ATP-binding protein [Acidobacteriota bacterium]|nr:ATP-binding protein [Acidobacteriota bacterium]
MRTTRRYSAAVVFTIAALVLTSALSELLAPMRLFFLWCAVFAAAIVGGLGPALVAIVLSLTGAMFLIFEPRGDFAIHSATDVLRLAMFALFAGGVSVIAAQRRSAAQRARASEKRYRTLIETTPVQQAVWTADANGNIEWAEEWARITGISREQLALHGGMDGVHPQDAPRTLERWQTALAQKTYYEDEIRVRVVGGQYRWFAIRAVPSTDRSGATEWVGIIADIHDRKRHEFNAAFINRASEVLASALGTEETMRQLARVCVPEIADSCAIDVALEESYDRIVVEHVDPSRVEMIREFDQLVRASGVQPVVDVLKSGKPQLVEEMTDEILGSFGSEKIVELGRALQISSWAIAPMRARGRTVGALVLAYNESRRHYTSEDLPLIEELARRAAIAIDNARLYEAAEAANRAKDEFLATVSHELRTPLTAISGWAHMLQLGMTDEKNSRLAVDTILRSAKAQGELIDDLLDLSRVVAGTLHLDVQTVDLATIVEEVATAARPAADARRLTLSYEASHSLHVRGDERRLRQIVWNLVSNAVKFTDAGGSVRLVLSLQGKSARVEVHDTGRGIDPAFLPYVWDRFRQADSSTSREYGGLGLGLAVVRHLTELHGGTVGVESEGRGRGATFRVDLPLARHDEGIASKWAREDDKTLLRGKRILVVDDAPDARLVLATMLKQYGATVDGAESVKDALALVARERFDLIVSDIAMPGEDGYDLVQRVRALSDVPVIAVSAIGSGADDHRRAMEAGFAEFVRKPVEPGQLALAAAAALG